MENPIRGDSLDFFCEINLNLTGYKLRASLYDNKAIEIRKATLNSGGSDTQILITNLSGGKFTIFVIAGETTEINLTAFLEIETEDSTGKIKTYKIYKEENPITFETEKITWSTP